MFFQNLLLVTFCFVVRSQNVEVRNAYQIYLRGGAAGPYTFSEEPAYAGYTFDVTKERNNSVKMLVGQPREGIVDKDTSTGRIIYCQYVDFPDDARSNEVNTSISSLVKKECNIEEIFDSTDRTQTGDSHDVAADALGLTLGNIDHSGNYAVCSQGRHKICKGSNNVVSSPGACYFGNHDKKWQFLPWNESKCFDKFVEIIFIVDGSNSISDSNFAIIRNWLVNATKSLEESYGDAVRTEVLQFSRMPPAHLRIPIANSDKYFVIPYTLNDALSIEEIERRIMNMAHLKSSTYTHYALRRAVEVEFPRSAQYMNSVRVVVVLTDGEARDYLTLPDWWDKYGKTGWLIPFAIGVGDYANFMKQLRVIANGDANSSRVLAVDSFDKLPDIISNLTSSIAAAVSSEGQSSVKTAGNSTENRQMGSSMTSLKDGSIHFGSVGMYLDSGTVMRYDSASDTDPDVISYDVTERALPGTTPDSYLGYSTVSGYFNGQSQGQYIAAGAPRYKLKGAVVLYLPINSSKYVEDTFTILPPSDTRDQVAAYFGGCLMSVDVNGDGFDDLFVASPLFVGENYDEGRVSVYIGNGSTSVSKWTQRSFLPIELFGDRSHRARFGLAMAAAGDLNLDGFQDVIIGAPTANGGSGAVFIYHGMSGGISSQYTQRILASSLTGTTLQYFGQSLKGGVDVDGNGYPDIFVGSPKTDSVVMLKSRPIARLSSSIQFLDSKVDFFTCVFTNGYENCAAIKVCFLADGASVEDTITLAYTITLDPTLSSGDRAVFTSSYSKSISKILSIPKQTWRCLNFSLSILNNATDFSTPIEAKVEYGLSENHTKSRMSSVTDRASENTNVTTIDWEKDCLQGVCYPDLFVNGTAAIPSVRGQSSTIVISPATANEPVTMTVNFGNRGENSFYTKLKVTYPANVSITPVQAVPASSKKCVEEDGSSTVIQENAVQLYKFVGGVIVKGRNSLCSFALNASFGNLRQESSLASFNVTFTIFSGSRTSVENASTLHDNTWTILAPIKYESDYTLRSDIGETSITFNYTEGDILDVKSIEQIGLNTSDVEVDIRITSNGYSNIPLSEITFTYPWLIDGVYPILYLYKLECPTLSGKARCTCNTSFVDRYNLNNVADSNGTSSQSGSGEGETAAPSLHPYLDQNIICPRTDGSSNYSCAVIPCTISDLDSSAEVHFKGSFRLWTGSLNGMFSNSNITSLSIRSNLKMSVAKSPLIIGTDGELLPTKEQEVVVIAKQFIKEVVVPTESDDTLLYIILGVGGGVLFLALVACALWKCGFFKNQYRERLDDMTEFTDEEKAAAKIQASNQQEQIESPGSVEVQYSAAIASTQIHTTASNGIESNTTSTTEEASALQALQDVNDANDSDPDYDEPPDDDEPDYDLPPDEDLPPSPPA